jgi:hypothetical protein
VIKETEEVSESVCIGGSIIGLMFTYCVLFPSDLIKAESECEAKPIEYDKLNRTSMLKASRGPTRMQVRYTRVVATVGAGVICVVGAVLGVCDGV